MANTFRVETYRSPKILSVAVISILGLQLLCFVAYFFLSLAQIAFPDMVLDPEEEGTMSVFFVIIGLVAFLEILLLIVGIIVFLIWVHQAYGNLSPLRARDLEFSPGWAVGWWFIPFLHLVRPYQVMKELWIKSDPEYDEENNFLSPHAAAPAFFPFWCGAWIVSNLASRIADKAADLPDGSISEYFPVLLMISAVVRTAAAVLLIYLVRNISIRQDLRAQRIDSSLPVNPLPPPPPNFQEA